jgi:hypothetical protein
METSDHLVLKELMVLKVKKETLVLEAKKDKKGRAVRKVSKVSK